MATLRHLADGRTHAVLSEYLIGRGATCHLRVDDRRASTAHAQLRWIGDAWEIRDLGSRNGTFVDGRPLDPGERLLVEAGATIAFGDADNVYELIDDGAPIPRAIGPGGRVQTLADGMLVLPAAERPQITVFPRGGQWVADTLDGERVPVRSGGELVVDAEVWTLDLPTAVEHTHSAERSRVRLREVAFRFLVSPDEEHIELQLTHRHGVVDLPSRAHMELLLRLAEARIEHQRDGDVPASEAGWVYVSDLLGALGIPADVVGHNLLCQRVFQARKHIAGADIDDAVDIVERRSTISTEGTQAVRQMRIGAARIEVERR